jgi:hypothetical protein
LTDDQQGKLDKLKAEQVEKPELNPNQMDLFGLS